MQRKMVGAEGMSQAVLPPLEQSGGAKRFANQFVLVGFAQWIDSAKRAPIRREPLDQVIAHLDPARLSSLTFLALDVDQPLLPQDIFPVQPANLSRTQARKEPQGKGRHQCFRAYRGLEKLGGLYCRENPRQLVSACAEAFYF